MPDTIHKFEFDNVRITTKVEIIKGTKFIRQFSTVERERSVDYIDYGSVPFSPSKLRQMADELEKFYKELGVR